jgi:hypothetical protein
MSMINQFADASTMVLSPAAQAVYNAVLEICPAPADEIAAAALRALAVRINGADAIRQDILAIAAELEGQ